ncbi:MAG: histidinol-phosphate transaminase [Pseudomonadota bacterium]|nr:histidinol-phosphate transaminase [Pseudomonadota bacterium]
MSGFLNRIRPDLRELASYSSARTEAGGFVASIALDANESPWPPFGPIAAHCPLHRYPEPQPAMLRQRLASIWSTPAEKILLGRGSDEGIDLLIRLFCRAGTDEILICPPTFGMYKVYASIQGAKTLETPLNGEGQLDVPAILKTCTPQTKLIFIPSPNAPMGQLMRREDILELCKRLAGRTLIVIDEAYIEFTARPEGLVADLGAHSDLVILRTLSKSHALAGERVGAVLGAADLLGWLQKVQAPYPLTQSSIRATLDALSPNGFLEGAERRRLIVSERNRMAKGLAQSSLISKVFPSDANFLLVETKDAEAFFNRLKAHAILPRNRHSLIPNTVRISIGSPEDNNMVLKALDIEVRETATALTPRLYSTRRATKETSIDVTVNLDEPGFLNVETGIGFFDHMLAQLASHGGFGLEMHCQGDLVIDQHHSIEDCALALGQALKAALGDKRGIARFGFTAPLDEALAQVTVDLSGRPYCSFNGSLPAPMIGTMSSEMVPHFFQSLAMAMGAAVHIAVEGENSHHMVEACFKATGRSLRQAFAREGRAHSIPSTKGVL